MSRSSTAYRAERVVVQSGSDCQFTTTGRDLAYVLLEKAVPDVEPMPVDRERFTSHCEYMALGYGRSTVVEDAQVVSETAGDTHPLCSSSETGPGVGANRPEEPIVPVAERRELVTCAEPGVEGSYLVARTDAGSNCVGDSGSPLIDDRTGMIVGIASASVIDEAGVMCVKGSKNRYTAVADYLDFIDQALAAASASRSEPAKPDSSSEGCAFPGRSAVEDGANAWSIIGVSSFAIMLSIAARRRRRDSR